MWTRAFLLIALVLGGGLPAPSLVPRSSGVGIASAQVTPVGDAFAVECVRGGSATRRARSSGSQSMRAAARRMHARIDAHRCCPLAAAAVGRGRPPGSLGDVSTTKCTAEM
jgi:hypothetical protein